MYVPVQIINHKPKPKWFNSSVFKQINRNTELGILIKLQNLLPILSLIQTIETLLLLLRGRLSPLFKLTHTNNVKHKLQNPSLFWKYIRGCTRVHHDVGILLQDDGSFTHSGYESANTLNKFFIISVFTKELMTNIPTLLDRSIGYKLHNIILTHQDVLDQLNLLNTEKSYGLIIATHGYLKKLKMGSFTPLLYFNKSFDEAILPTS